ncbi:tetratricopeptide repeat protein [bacterium]|nr:tetratricopeptide repeat protein [bacterium]
MLKKIASFIFLMISFATFTFAAEVPIDAKLDYNQGIDFYKLGMYERAIESFRSAIREYSDYIDAYYNLGTILEYLKNYSEALVVFKQIYVRNPNDYEIIYKLASISYKLEDNTNALKYIALIPQTSEYYSKALELSSLIDKHTVLPTKPQNQVSQIANHSGIYENIVSPTGVTTDNQGNLYVALFSDNSIIKITPDNKRTVFLKNKQISGPISLASDSIGNIYVSNYNANNVLKVTPSGSVSILIEKLNKPYGLHVDKNMLFITCQGSNSVYRKKITD